jgi:hypothetical protein
MNQGCFKRECLNRLGRPPPATVQTTLQWLPSFRRKNRGQGLCSGSTGGVFPPTFAIASPRSSEGEAMAKAGGKEMVFWFRERRYR